MTIHIRSMAANDAPRTQASIEAHLPRDLATLAHGYLRPGDTASDWDIGLSGHGELCLTIFDMDEGLGGACQCSHIELVRLMIEHGANECYYCGRSMADHHGALSQS